MFLSTVTRTYLNIYVAIWCYNVLYVTNMYDYTCMIPRDFFVANMDSSFLRHGTSKESQATPLHLRTRTASVRQCLANSKINKHQIDLQNVDLSN